MHIDPDQIQAFNRDGVVHLPELFDERWVALLRDGIEENLNRPGPNGHDIRLADSGSRFFEDAFVWPQIEQYRQFLFESHAAQVAAQLMQSQSVYLFFDNVFVKEPGSYAATPWHQDQPAVSLAGQMFSLWVALDPIPKSDCLEIVRGSHRWGKSFVPIRFSDLEEKVGFDFEPMVRSPNFDAMRDDLDIASWDMQPGDALAFDGMSLHGSGENTTSLTRRAFSVRFGGDDATYLPKGPASFPKFPGRDIEPGDSLGNETFPLLFRR